MHKEVAPVILMPKLEHNRKMEEFRKRGIYLYNKAQITAGNTTFMKERIQTSDPIIKCDNEIK